MKYVLDSNVALKGVLPEADSDRAIQLRDDFHSGTHELIAPDVFPVECLHALTKAERQSRITGAFILWQSIMADVPRLHSHIPFLHRAYEIATITRSGIYDCIYVALAEQESCELITADDRLVRNMQRDFPFVRSLASLP